MPKKSKAPSQPGLLIGWQSIAVFLGQSASVAQRWAGSGMPVTRNGRRVQASADELSSWLRRESAGEPLQISTPDADLTAELKRGLSFVRKQDRNKSKRKAA